MNLTALAVAGMLAVAPLHSSRPADVSITDPGIGIEVTPSGSLIRFHYAVTTNFEPRTFSVVQTMWRWPIFGKAKEYALCGQHFTATCIWAWDKDELPPVGQTKTFNFKDILCTRTIIYFKIIAGGITDQGLHLHRTLFFPAGDGGNDVHEQPTRSESHRITSCHPH